jgi:peptide/nickel transport system substrate-binding protein
MNNPYNKLRNLRLPLKNKIKLVFSTFTKIEWRIFIVLVSIFFVSTIVILQKINKSFMVPVPMVGGSVSEGIIGTPRFVNPILALSSADQDLVSLIYSGLMRKNEDGILMPDLAEKVDISKDGLTYTFTLKNGIYFHDNTPVTADDVVFTITSAKDPVIKSPQKIDWDGVSVEKIDERTVKFSLRQPYSSFLENATIGIMPAHVWNNSPIELNDANTNPIGSGPYMVNSTSKQASGIIDTYELVSFKKFALGVPYIKNITLRFYSNENSLITALENKQIDQISSITPINAQILKEGGFRVESAVLPRVFGLFFNQNQNQLFTNKNIVKAIDQAIDKNQIVHEILAGFGVVIENPIPQNIIPYQKLSGTVDASHEEGLNKAKEILAKDGWKIGSSGYLEKTTTVKKKKSTTLLEFSISTGNTPELAKSAELIKKDLESIGMKVEIKTFEVGNLNQSVIRPRKYETLLFGQIINHESDLYAFWHSSQRKDPGLNIAMYTNAKVDKILEDAFITVDETNRIKKYAQFEEEIKKDMPAIFLYSPNFIYIVSKDIKRISINHMISPSDRFLNAYLWYTKTDNVWRIFSK